jgi:hypothetical protein
MPAKKGGEKKTIFATLKIVAISSYHHVIEKRPI